MLDPADPSPDDPLVRPQPPRSWRERVEDLADATGTTPARLAIGGVAVAALLAAGLWLLRPPPAPVEVSLPFASTTSTLPPSPATSTEDEVVLVHVAGAVRAPGVHELAPAARVVDAIEAAGGLTDAADAARINLAAPVSDGERVYVPGVGEEPPPVAVGGSGGGGDGADGAAGPVDLNTADSAALDALPGVGPATAAAILEHRTQIGRFSSVDQLLDVPGIGEAKLAALRDLVAV